MTGVCRPAASSQWRRAGRVDALIVPSGLDQQARRARNCRAIPRHQTAKQARKLLPPPSPFLAAGGQFEPPLHGNVGVFTASVRPGGVSGIGPGADATAGRAEPRGRTGPPNPSPARDSSRQPSPPPGRTGGGAESISVMARSRCIFTLGQSGPRTGSAAPGRTQAGQARATRNAALLYLYRGTIDLF